MTWLSVLRACYGVAVWVAPDELSGHLRHMRLARPARRAMRVLALRQLAEAAVCAVEPTPCVLRLEALVDVIHGATMAVVAVTSSNASSRRAAAVNVGAAAGFVVADMAMLSRTCHDNTAVVAQHHPIIATRDRIARKICLAAPWVRA